MNAEWTSGRKSEVVPALGYIFARELTTLNSQSFLGIVYPHFFSREMKTPDITALQDLT